MGPAAASLAASRFTVPLCTATESATTPRAAACLGAKPRNVGPAAASLAAALCAVRPPAGITDPRKQRSHLRVLISHSVCSDFTQQ